MKRLSLFLLLCLPALAGDVVTGNDLEKGKKIEAGGAAIDLSDGVGHAAPLFVDWDGDGLSDLLVGQFQGGKLRIYKNVGEKAAPRFDACDWFKAAGEIALVPTG